jgi:hypothetical protein
MTGFRHRPSRGRVSAAVLALLAAGLVWVSADGSPTDAQVSNEPAEVVSRAPGGGGPWGRYSAGASISANGAIVVFNSARPTPSGSVDVVAIRNRLNDSTVDVPSTPSYNGAISDDGCVVAYSAGIRVLSLLAYNRCNNTTAVVSPSVSTGFALPPPAVSANGSVIAVSTGVDVRVFERSGADYVPIAVIGSRVDVGPVVSISDDGNIVAYSARSAGTIAVFPFVVFTWDRRTGGVDVISRGPDGNPAGGGNSIEPSISGDGRLVAFTSDSGGLIAPPGSPGNDVYVFDRSTGQMRMVAGGSWQPAMSRDGRHVALTQLGGELGEIYVARSTSPNPFATSAVDLVSYSLAGAPNTTGGAAARPAISDSGRWVAFDSYAGDRLTTDARFHDGFNVYVRERPPVLQVGAVDFGPVGVGSSADRQTTVTNVGLSNWVITAAETTPGFSLLSSNCPLAVAPGASCQATIRFSPGVAGAAQGTFTVRDTSYPARPLQATGALRGAGVTSGTPPPNTPPGTPPTTPPPGSTFSLTADPLLVEFPLSPVGQPSEPRSVTITNTGTAPNQVSELVIAGAAADDYTVAVSDCPDATLAPGATCTVSVVLTPRDSGDRLASVQVTGQGGSAALSFLRGIAFFEPLIVPEPPVAAPGQVVTLVGVGFPPLVPVTVTWEVDDQEFDIVPDELGSFRHPAVVLAATGFGDRLITSPAVLDSYLVVEAQLLIAPGTMQPRNVITVIRTTNSHLSR